MARPSKLTDRQWGEVGRRITEGESMGKLAKEYKVGVSTISERFGGKSENIRNLATSLVTLEQEIESLPVSEQRSVMSLADRLKGISNGLAKAANHGANVSAKLAELAEKRMKTIDQDSPVDDLKPVAAFMETANRAGSMGIGMLQANKAKVDAQDDAVEPRKVLFEVIRPKASA